MLPLLTVKALRVTIDRSRQAVSFEGPGTFDNKETIRSLGPSRWYGDRKIWEIAPCTLDEEKIKALFPNNQIEFSQTESAAAGGDNGGINGTVPYSPKPASFQSVPDALTTSNGADVDIGFVQSASAAKGAPAGIGVSQLLESARAALRGTFPRPILIYGVLIQVKRMATGRVFLDLADAEKPDERVSGVIWSNEQTILEPLVKRGFVLEKDLPVMFEAGVELSRRDGRLTIVIRGVVAEFTVAKLQAQRDTTNRRLKDEGLFDRNRALRLPILPRRLGILTSAAGTVIHDFRTSLDAAKFGFELVWYHSAMQGLDAKEQILAGIKALSELPQLDAILIFRGGGGAAELAVFNDYEIAKAAALAPIPVISAIGHQEDQCSLQDVSFRALGVPKDVGRFFADIVVELRRAFESSVETISGFSQNLVEQSAQRFRLFLQAIHGLAQASVDRASAFVEAVVSGLPILSGRLADEQNRKLQVITAPFVSLVGRGCDDSAGSLKVLSDRIGRDIRQIHDRSVYALRLSLDRFSGAARLADIFAERVGGFERLVEQVRPERQLQRGFTMIRRTSGGEIVTAAGGLKPGEDIEIQFHDNVKQAKILK